MWLLLYCKGNLYYLTEIYSLLCVVVEEIDNRCDIFSDGLPIQKPVIPQGIIEIEDISGQPVLFDVQRQIHHLRRPVFQLGVEKLKQILITLIGFYALSMLQAFLYDLDFSYFSIRHFIFSIKPYLSIVRWRIIKFIFTFDTKATDKKKPFKRSGIGLSRL